MATTTNYGWTTPDDTALVKDGAAAIRTLGSSVDTTTKALNPSTTLGDIEYRSSTANTNTRLAIGTTGQILTVSGGVPAWGAAPSSGGMTLISETVASASTGISFTSLGSYKQLLLMYSGILHSATGTAFSLRFNNSSSSTYEIVGMQIGTSSFSNTAGAMSHVGGSHQGTMYSFGNNANTNLTSNVSGSILIDNYTSATKSKTCTVEYFYYDTTGDKYQGQVSMMKFADTTAITSLDIVRISGSGTFSNNGNSTIRLYGIS